MTRFSYAQTVDALHNAGMQPRELSGPGHVAVTLAAGRVIALAFEKNGANLLWTNPDLSDADLARNHPEKLVGGIGGDRLWFAPELSYHWRGVPDWGTLTNYTVPASSDPGDYRFVDATREIELRGTAQLRHRTTDERVGFAVSRTIRMVAAPLAGDPLMRELMYVGIETSHILRFDADTMRGQLDLWHLLQVPIGSVLVVPLKSGPHAADTRPLSYTGAQIWGRQQDKLLRRYDGAAYAKFGVSVRALTGRTAVLQRPSPDIYCLLVRQFSIDPNAKYGDHPHGVARTDQAFQAWDGLGFGEMEYHSPMLDAQSGPRELRESDQLWAFGGSQAAIGAIGKALLGCDITDAFQLMSGDWS